MTSDDQMLSIEAAYMELTTKFIDNGISPYAMAAIMTKLGMMIYKSSLSAEDYNLMVASISNRRDLIKSFDEYGQRLRLN